MNRQNSSPHLTDRPEGAPWPIADAADYLCVSLRHLVRLADAQKVKTIRFGRRRMVPDFEVRRLAAEGVTAS
jgi:excisionase family DNA binding protein